MNSMVMNEHIKELAAVGSTHVRFKHFYPFLGYVVPTVLITYMIAVPRSCFAGINAQTIGFAVAMIAAGLAYWLGVRLALRGGTALRLRHYIPLIIFLILTIAIGYGFVIRGSCIAGLNEHSVGFGVSLFFASIVYAQGVRKALPGWESEHASRAIAKPMRIRHFYPLVGFVVPTLIIGYGVVIPRSGIAATSKPGVGFGMALLGAAAAYLQGVRLALREDRTGPT
jgi:hypothetical protein